MAAARLRRPVLVVAQERPPVALHKAYTADRLQGWEPREAADVLHARFLLQFDAADVLLLDVPGPPGEEDEAIVRLAARHGVPVVVLSVGGWAGGEEGKGWHLCLPRDLALAYPVLLDEALAAAVRCRRLLRDVSRAAADLRECGRRAERLAALLWETPRSPATPSG
jgi:hypothetical protein